MADLIFYSVEIFWGSVVIVAGLALLRLVLALMRERRAGKYKSNTNHKLHV